MRFGLCISPDNFELAGRLGFDYVEVPLSPIAAFSEGEFLNFQAALKAGSLKAERANVLFPGTIRLIGPEADKKQIDAYLEGAFSRAAALGIVTAVFGSGRSRAIPPGCSFREGYRELVLMTRRIGDIAANHRINIAIEPLNREETNCINSLREGAMLQHDADRDSVGLLADLYHMLRENESIESLILIKDLLHTHIALLEGRGFPVKKTGEVEQFFLALEKAGYRGTMSIEGRTENLESDAAEALALLRSLA
ncbi:MAG: sugar phosphate isomerase/epimerase [Treponema sp.]|jgi:sugar phosphate isomerase/epimerase|nr:sugar phosphate isomerase/epimerase [Treponema sp.]